MAQSTRYRLLQILRGVVEAVATAQGARALYNPPLPVGVKDKGPRVLFLLDRGDELTESGQHEKRQAIVVFGALVVPGAGGDPDALCDEMHWALRLALREVDVSVAMAGEGKRRRMREVKVEPELRELQLEGSLLLSAFEVSYYETYTAA